MSSQPSRRQYDTLKHNLSPRLPASDEYPLPMDTPRLSRGGDSWRPNEHQSPSINEFSFRNNNTAPLYPGEDNQSIPSRHPTTQDRYHPSLENRDKRRLGGSQRAAKRYGVYKGPQRGNYHRIATAARPLLSLKQEGAQEQMLGTADNANATKRFLSVDEMSDSGDEQMEESESDTDLGSSEAIVSVESKMNSATEKEANNDAEPPTKRRVIEATTTEHRWSNPDPYTSLPPVDDSLRKKRDVVKIIRKARIPTDRAVNTSDQAAANDDFISLGFEDSSKVTNVGQSSHRVTGDLKGGGLAIPDVPSRAKEFSHLAKLRKDDFLKAPGTQGLSLQPNQLGPPPSLEKAEKSSLGEMNSDKRTILDHDGALGNRKRTHDDVIKSTIQRPPKPRKGYSETSQGHLVDQWVPRDGVDPTPWHDGKASVQSGDMGFRLHKEICDFYDFVRPQKHEQRVREDLLNRLQNIVQKRFRNSAVYCFGSFAAGLYLPNADMDIVVISERFRASGVKVACRNPQSMYDFAWFLRNSHVAEENSVEVIPKAKVPLIKFVDRITAIRVDVSFENHTGLIANETFNTWKNQYPAMPILVTLIKQFLMMRGLNEVVNGGLGGFSVTCMVTSLLQNMPRVQNGDLIPEQHLGEMLIEFLDLYGNQLDTSRTGIMMDPPGYFDKYDFARNKPGRSVYQANKAERLAIMDPNMPDNDISGGSRNVQLILDRFSRAHAEILNSMRSPNERSLLRWLLGGDYDNFTWQRNHLSKIYREKWGSPPPDLADFRKCSPEISQSKRNTSTDRNEGSSDFFINPLDPGSKPTSDKLLEKQTRRLSKKEKQISKTAKQKIPLLEQPLEEPESERKIKKPTRNLTLLLEEEVLSLWQESLDWKEASPGMIQSFRSRLDAHQMTSSAESHEDNDFRRIQEPPTPISPGGDHPDLILSNTGQAHIAPELSGTSLSNPITIK